MKLTILTLFALLFGASNQQKFDPTAFDYCTQQCFSQEHVACNCTLAETRELILADIGKFRRNILHIHNYWRNFVASGQAVHSSPNVPAASDMLIFNYDTELEYIAQCTASKFDAEPSACRDTHDGMIIGQNVASSREQTEEAKLVKMWYDEITFVENTTIDFYETTSKGVVEHFAQLMWSRSNLLGCARVWNEKMFNSSLKFSLICNYGSTQESGAATVGTSVYKKGQPCSDCPFGTECETDKYKALCGKSFSISEAASTWGIAIRWKGKKILLACIFASFYTHFTVSG